MAFARLVMGAPLGYLRGHDMRVVQYIGNRSYSDERRKMLRIQPLQRRSQRLIPDPDKP
jgi:hypothetical protein